MSDLWRVVLHFVPNFGIVFLIAILLSPNLAISKEIAEIESNKKWSLIETILDKQISYLEKFAATERRARRGEGRYWLQIFLNDVAIEAIRADKRNVSDRVLDIVVREIVDSEIYAALGAGQRTLPSGAGSNIGLSDAKSIKWLAENGSEPVLSSSQFVYFLASTTRVLLQHSATLNEVETRFLHYAAPVVKAHIERWVFGPEKIWQVRSWSCGGATYTHEEFIRRKVEKRFSNPLGWRHCNGITDIDTWIIASAAELLEADRIDKFDAIRLEPQTRRQLIQYVRTAVGGMKSRTAIKRFTKFGQDTVQGFVFDPGAWDDHPDHKYAGYLGSACPTLLDSGRSESGWDISHGTRQVSVFMSLFETKAATGVDWPSAETIAGFGRAMVYGVWNGDREKPLFRNFLDGSNGWYRANGVTCSGFPPWTMSIGVLMGGWWRWTPYEPEMIPMLWAIWNLLNATHAEKVKFRSERFEASGFSGGKLTWNKGSTDLTASRWLLPFLATMPTVNRAVPRR